MGLVRRGWLPWVVLALALGFAGAAAEAQSWRTVDTRDMRERREAREAHALQVDGFDVEQVHQVVPGAQLVFTVFGTPGAVASVHIEGAQRGSVDLPEVQPGVYEGTYLVEGDDRIGPDGRVTATLRRGAAVARALLEEPLQLAGGPAPPREAVAASAPAAAARPAPGDDKPPPVFAGATRVRAAPSTPSAPPALPAVIPAAVTEPVAPSAPAPCADCAVVEAIRAVEIEGEPTPVGTISGALIGAVFGDRVAREHDRAVGRILGAIGGAFIGREIERRSMRRTRYDVLLRLPNGASQTRSFLDSPPALRVGDTVRLEATVARAGRVERWPPQGGPHGSPLPGHGGTP